MNMMITGAGGYIGSHAVRKAINEGHRVIAVDDFSHGFPEAIDPRAIVARANIENTELMSDTLQTHSIEAIVHFSAYSEVRESITNPAKYYLNNVARTIKFLEAVKESEVKYFIFSSSAAVYGEPLYTPIDEDHPKAPLSPYGRTKLMVEQILSDYSQVAKFKYTSLRYFNVAGASPEGDLGEAHEPETHLIPIVLKVALGELPFVQIFGSDYNTPDGTCIRDYIHVEDLVQAHFLAISFLQLNHSEVFNLGSERGFSVREVIETCRRVTGKSIETREEPRRVGDPAILVASSIKSRTELNWTPKFPELDSMVLDAWNWHRKHPKGYRS
ncbi:MAG: galE [Bacteriovoracaceae bacterium]|nr:galE [Bacteriovoracaceae bacterium]